MHWKHKRLVIRYIGRALWLYLSQNVYFIYIL
nr:MAG TPA: hypothetical protein [Caudoviricetes sp.]